jgi:hypothetical protein
MPWVRSPPAGAEPHDDRHPASLASGRERHHLGPSVKLSLVVAGYSMERELPRTIESLSRRHQRGVDGLAYEIVVVDNGSPLPLDRGSIEAIGPEVRLLRLEGLGVSPAAAVNRAVAESSGENIGIVLDGARMVTPGVLALADAALQQYPDALVTTLAWHLGPQHQSISQLSGYSQAVEDQLLDSIEWPAQGYRLFEISALAGANREGWFGPVNESCCTFVSRQTYEELGGYDESFASPGGGYVNLDFFSRATARPGPELIVLLGEGSFHQFHGGTSSNAPDPDHWKVFAAEYESVRGMPYSHPTVDPLYLGRLHPAARRWLPEPPPNPALHPPEAATEPSQVRTGRRSRLPWRQSSVARGPDGDEGAQ